MVAEKEIPKGFQKTEIGIIPSDWEVKLFILEKYCTPLQNQELGDEF